MYKGDYFSYNITVSRAHIDSGAPVIFLPFHKVVSNPYSPRLRRTGQPVKAKPKAKKATVVAQAKPQKKIETKKKKPKKEVKKVAENKKSSPQTKSVKKKVTQAKPVPKKIEKPQVVQSVQPISEQAPVYVGQVQMEALRMQDEMHAVISEHWKPPVGLSKDLVCVLKILVDWNGAVKQTTVHESSGVLVYDVSARTAVAHASAPKSTYGKEFYITFKQ